MKIVYVRSSLPDLVWFRTCYRAIFPEGERHALLQRRAMERLLCENPFAGRLVQDDTGGRKFPISRTPFVVVCRVLHDRIEVLRVWDGRRDLATFRYEIVSLLNGNILAERCPAHRARFATPGDLDALQIFFANLRRVGLYGPPIRPAGLAVDLGYDPRRPDEYPTPSKPTE